MGAIEFNLPISKPFTSNLVTTEFDKELFNTLWISVKENLSGPQNFSLSLMDHLHSLVLKIQENQSLWNAGGEIVNVHYAIMKSEHPDYFSLGGDLAHFRQCIDEGDAASLFSYSKLCLDVLYNWSQFTSQGITTVALVQGRALGGGFEAALSADFLIAEEQSQFGFPEIMFGLFPCTGGMSLLARRVGVHQAEFMMSNGRIYSAQELKDMGVVDHICPQGHGELTVQKFIKAHAKHKRARLMLQRSRHRIAPIDYNELLTVVHEWVELALQLEPEELRAMDMLITMQEKGIQEKLSKAA